MLLMLRALSFVPSAMTFYQIFKFIWWFFMNYEMQTDGNYSFRIPQIFSEDEIAGVRDLWEFFWASWNKMIFLCLYTLFWCRLTIAACFYCPSLFSCQVLIFIEIVFLQTLAINDFKDALKAIKIIFESERNNFELSLSCWNGKCIQEILLFYWKIVKMQTFRTAINKMLFLWGWISFHFFSYLTDFSFWRQR